MAASQRSFRDRKFEIVVTRNPLIYFAKKFYSKYAFPSQNFGIVRKLISKVTTLIHNIFFRKCFPWALQHETVLRVVTLRVIIANIC